MQSILDTFKDLTNKYKSVISLYELIQSHENIDEEDRSKEFLSDFMEIANSSIILAEEKIKSVESKYVDMISFFGDNTKEMPMETFLQIIIKFYKDFHVFLY